MAAKKKEAKKITEKVGTKEIDKIAVELFGNIGLDVELNISEDKNNDAILISIDTEDEAGLIIGNRGRNLSALQTVLGMIYRQRVGEWKRILLDVSDWREKEEERLKNLAEHTAKRAIETGEAQSLYNLTPSQRRIVHMALSEEKEVSTESKGEGNNRYLVVSLKK